MTTFKTFFFKEKGAPGGRHCTDQFLIQCINFQMKTFLKSWFLNWCGNFSLAFISIFLKNKNYSTWFQNFRLIYDVLEIPYVCNFRSQMFSFSSRAKSVHLLNLTQTLSGFTKQKRKAIQLVYALPSFFAELPCSKLPSRQRKMLHTDGRTERRKKRM